MVTAGAGPRRSANGMLREHDFARWARGRLIDVIKYLDEVKWHPNTPNHRQTLREQMTMAQACLLAIEENWSKKEEARSAE